MKFALILLLCVLPGFLGATTGVKFDIDQLCDNASTVAQGKITAKEARWDDAHAAIWTHYTVDVSEVAKGDSVTSLEFVTRGGSVGRVGQSVSGAGDFSKDDEYVFFLAVDSDKRLQLVGMIQGAFKISEVAGKKKATNGYAGLSLVDAKTLKPLAKEDQQAIEFELPDLLKRVRDRVAAATVKAAPADKKAEK